MFEEMDEIFTRLFSRVQQQMSMGEMPVSGYHIVIQGGGRPAVEDGMQSLPSRVTQSPAAEVHRIDDMVMVVAELPGAPQESVRLDISGQRLIIDAGPRELPYHTTADLPPGDAGSMQHTFKNGVLEVTFRAPAGEPESP
jgi:HSP20 family molecular chaperone IbpA